MSDHRLCFINDVRRRKEPHSICKPEEMLSIAVQFDPIKQVSVQKQFRSAHNEICIDRLPLRGLSRDSLQPILVSLSVNGGGQRGATSYEGPKESRKRTEQSWIYLHFGSRNVPASRISAERLISPTSRAASMGISSFET